MMTSGRGEFITDEMSFQDIEVITKDKSTLIIPIGGFEPLGNDVPIGLVNDILQRITEMVVKENCCLSAPLIKYGYSTPFSAFSGAFSVKRNILESMLRSIVTDSFKWGFKKILFINLTTIPADFFPRLIKSISKKIDTTNILFFDFQNNNAIRKRAFGNQKNDMRLEQALLSLALKFELLKNDDIISGDNKDQKYYSQWKRRGRDPQLFRKKYPKGLVSQSLKGCSIEEGEIFLKLIIDTCGTLIAGEGNQ